MASERKDQVAAMGIFDGRFDDTVNPVVIPTVIAADGFATITRNGVGDYSVSLNVPPIAPRQGVPQGLPMGGALNKLSCAAEGDSVRVLSTDLFGQPADCPLFSLTLERTSSPGSADALPVVTPGAGGGLGAGVWFPANPPVATGAFTPVVIDVQFLNTDPANFVLGGGGVTVNVPGTYVIHQCGNWITDVAGGTGYRTSTDSPQTPITQRSAAAAVVNQRGSVGTSIPVLLAQAGPELVSQLWEAPIGAGSILSISPDLTYLGIQRIG